MADPMKTCTNALYVVGIILTVAVAYATGEDNVFLVNSKKAYLHDCGDSDSHCRPGIKIIDEECTCDIIAPIPVDTEVEIQCRVKGEKVVNDPWWLYVYVPLVDEFGWIADYYVECGPRICPGSRC